MNRFHIANNSILQNCVSRINEIRNAGGIPIVSISDKAESRSSKQNRLMRKWFSDIHGETKQGIIYEAGRCKFEYFVPVMTASKDEKTLFNYDLIMYAYHKNSYSYILEALGKGWIQSTSLLTTKEFAMALTEMQAGEYMHCLTDPSTYGLDMGRWE